MRIVVIGTVASAILGFRRELIIELIAQGHEVHAFAMDYCAKTKAEVLELGAMPQCYKLSRSGLNPLADLTSTLQLARIFNSLKPDLVFSFFSKPVIFATLAAKLAKVPRKVGMLEGLGNAFTKHPDQQDVYKNVIQWIQVQLYKISFRFLDCIIFLNKDDPIDLLKRFKINVRRVEVLGAIGLNIAMYPYCRAPTDPITFIFIGRLILEKGIRVFIDAARIVKVFFPNTRFVVLGSLDSSGKRSFTQKEIDVAISEGLIEHPGHVVNVIEWIARSSVFVLPSYYREGVPRSIQEAMAIGRAIITTDTPGCRETVVDGVNGFLVPNLKPDTLAKKMSYFIENKSAINDMGLKSREFAVAKYDVSVANKILIETLVPT